MPFDTASKSTDLPELFVRTKPRTGFRWLFIMNAARRERYLRELPRPEYVLHRVQSHEKDSAVKWKMIRWKPSVQTVLDPLHGYRGEQLPNGFYAVIRPTVVERIDRYRKALGIVHEFSSWEDLIMIALFRRQVTNCGGLIEIDMALYLLVCRAVQDGFFRPVEIKYLAARMPPRSQIRGMLYALAARELKKRLSKIFGSV